jgi:hypothetical protein
LRMGIAYHQALIDVCDDFDREQGQGRLPREPEAGCGPS